MKLWLARCLVRGASLARVSSFGLAHAGAPAASVLAFALVLWSSLAPNTARAEAVQPRDVHADAHDAAQVPRVPQDFLEERVGRVVLRYHRQDDNIAARLAARLPVSLRKVADELGISAQQALEVRIARSPAEMARLAPRLSPPPDYAVGVAYPALGLIILSVVDPQSWLPPNLDHVLTHELSHVLLHRAAGERPLPLWFVEGLAVHQAGEQRLGRIQTLWEAAVTDDVLSTAELSQRFPSRPNQVNLAYAESADLVEHLLRGERDRARLQQLITTVKAGSSFEQALLATYHVDLAYLEREWKRSLGERYRVLPMVLTGTALWGGIAILVVVAFWRRRKDQREKLSRWAEEEALEEARAQRELAQAVLVNTGRPAPDAELYVVAAQQQHDSTVPTIEHEGQRYTLH
jgi:hypothetical protein